MDKKKTPAIRFEGFTDNWEQRKLGELVEQIIREVPKPKHPYDRMSIRSHAKGTFKQHVEDPTKIAMTKLYVVKEDDLVVNITFAWEHAIAVVPKENENLLVSHRFPTYRADGKSEINFIKYLVSLESFRRKLDLISPGGAGRNRVLSKKEFIKLQAIVPPNIEEQYKIGNLFKQLDKTIALQEYQLELLKQQKKGFLQKMFPKENEKVPELRFEGFTDDWEQRKLSELMTFSNGINAPKENYGKGRHMISVLDILSPLPIKYDDIKNSVQVDKNTEDKNKVENGDLVFVRSSEIVEEVGWAKAYLEDNYALYSGFTIRGKRKEKFDSYFFELALNYSNRKQLERKAGGSTRYNVSQSILNSIELLAPDNLEQTKIGNFFKQLDETITLQERQLQKMKEMKTAFLQKMFI